MMRSLDTAGADLLLVVSGPALSHRNPCQVHHGVRAGKTLRRRLSRENIPRGTAQRTDRMPIARERLDQVPSDEAGSAGNRDVHSVLSNSSISSTQVRTSVL